MYEKRYGDPKVFEIAEKFSHFAKDQNLSPISLAVAWVASHPAVTAPIIGGCNSKQLKESLKSVDIKMTKKLEILYLHCHLNLRSPLIAMRNKPYIITANDKSELNVFNLIN